MLQQDTEKTSFPPFAIHPSFGKLSTDAWLAQISAWTTACQASMSITNSRSLHKLMSSESVMPSNHLILCHPLLFPPSIFPSIRVFSIKSALHIKWPKYWSFSFNISPSNEHPGLISFSMDWLDLLAVKETFKRLLQHHSSKASILRCSAFLSIRVPCAIQIRSDQINHSVVSDSLQPHESQHARPPCPSPSPGVHSNSHPSSQ